jgi:hypothetical protein
VSSDNDDFSPEALNAWLKTGRDPRRHVRRVFEKLPKFHSSRKTGKKSGRLPTNHERVVTGRAERMGISLAEYTRKFCS